ncbi:MAG: hypothetical protein MUC47_02705 [Candidatus Kapabacteria bacterium]|nr:hypothetical protein [Candidatus Kapabacteria bacterium]
MTCRWTIRLLLAFCVCGCVLEGCSSPLELDTPREQRFIDRFVTPTRLTIAYQVDSSAFEAIYSDPTFLSSIRIDTSADRFVVSIPSISTPLFSCKPSADASTVVRSFGFSVQNAICDSIPRDIINPDTFLNVLVMDYVGRENDYLWFVDGVNRRLRLAFVQVPSVRQVKGRIIINIANPHPQMGGAVLSSFGIMTIDY